MSGPSTLLHCTNTWAFDRPGPCKRGHQEGQRLRPLAQDIVLWSCLAALTCLRKVWPWNIVKINLGSIIHYVLVQLARLPLLLPDCKRVQAQVWHLEWHQKMCVVALTHHLILAIRQHLDQPHSGMSTLKVPMRQELQRLASELLKTPIKNAVFTGCSQQFIGLPKKYDMSATKWLNQHVCSIIIVRYVFLFVFIWGVNSFIFF